MTCTVRAMREADLDRVMAIADSLEEAPDWRREAYLAALEADHLPRRIALVAERGAELAGFVVASLVGSQAELESVAVEGTQQGRGIGRALLAELIGELRRAGVSELDLEVRESNGAALRLYDQAGFRVAGRRPGYYREPWEDALLMRLEVKSGGSPEGNSILGHGA